MVVPSATDGFDGVTDTDASAALLTVRIVEPVLPLRFADMADVPAD